MSDLKISLTDSKIRNKKSTTGDVKENNWDGKRVGDSEGGRKP